MGWYHQVKLPVAASRWVVCAVDPGLRFLLTGFFFHTRQQQVPVVPDGSLRKALAPIKQPKRHGNSICSAVHDRLIW